MKTPNLIFAVALGLLTVSAARAFDPVKGLPKTEVVFFEPEKFTDARDSYDSDSARTALLAELRTYLIQQANRSLPPGQQLKITVTDVDLAGEFEPWRGGSMADVRIVKEIYPPEIKLSFQLTAADGTVVKQGDRHLRDLSFMMNLAMNRDDPRRYEKELLDNWLRTEFHGLKNAK